MAHCYRISEGNNTLHHIISPVSPFPPPDTTGCKPAALAGEGRPITSPTLFKLPLFTPGKTQGTSDSSVRELIGPHREDSPQEVNTPKQGTSLEENKTWELWLQVTVTTVPLTCVLFAILVVVVCFRLRAPRRLVNSLRPFDERSKTLQLHNQHTPGVLKKMSPASADAIYRQPESSSIAPAAGVEELTRHGFPELPGEESGIKLFCQGADVAQIVLFLRGQSGGQKPRPESGTVSDSTYSMPESLTARHNPLDLTLKAPSSGTYLTPCDTDYFALPSPVKKTQHEYVLATSSSKTMTCVQLREEPFVSGGHNILGVNDVARGSNDAVGSCYNESYYSSID